MFKKIFPFCLLVFVLAACSPYCTDEQLVAANHLLPREGATVVSPRPTFSWGFEPPVDCKTYMFVVTAGITPFLDYERDWEINYMESSGWDLHIAPRYDAFEDCKIYYWNVRTTGPTIYRWSQVSMFKTDFTGACEWPPACRAGEPPMPNAILPYDGQVINTLNPELVWEPGEPACEPGDYFFEVSGSPEFTDDIIYGYTNLTMHSEPSPYLEDCHSYYWRVTARNMPSTSHSMIRQFWVNTGTCPVTSTCTPDQILADTLVLPVGGAEVTDPRPYLVWRSNLPVCLTGEQHVIVSELEDFSTHVIAGGGTTDDLPFPDSTVFSAPFEVYRDCTTYFWKTSEGAGDVTVWSDVATFNTNFEGACGESVYTPRDDLLEHLRFDCISPNLTVIIFEFSAPVQGEYAARVDDKTWSCEFQGNDNQMLICTGPYVQENVKKQVQLLDLNTQKVVLQEDVTTPICELPTSQPKPPSCKEPAIPCIQFGCVWNPDACRCEKNGGVCPGQ